jgi:hypothetical protein
MREKTTLADRYLYEHFYESCTVESQSAIGCSGVELDADYSWYDVVLCGEKKCRECEFRFENQGFYQGKNIFSNNFANQEFVRLKNIRTQEEFEAVCGKICEDLRGIIIDGAVSDASPLEQFKKLEFVVFEGHRLSCFWNTSKNPELRMLTVWINKHLQSLSGLEYAENLECLQFYKAPSDVGSRRVESFEPISKLPRLKELVLSATGSFDTDMEYLISIPALEYLWISPNLFSTENYAKFEAKKFMLSDEYGIYLEQTYDIYPYGKGKRVMHTDEQKRRYLVEYNELLKKYS